MNNFNKSKNNQRANKMNLKSTGSKSNFANMNIRNIVEENKIKRVVENSRENNTANCKGNNSSEKKCKIEIIRAGESKNGRIYTEESIAKIPSLIEGKKKMFIDHTDDLENRSLKDWAATIINVWYDEKEKTVFAEIKVHSDWLWERIIDSPYEIGVSIDAVGVLSEQGGFIYVKDIIELNSVDFVTSAAAGGGIYNSLIKESIRESIRQSVIRENIKESEMESVSKIVESIALKLERNMERNIRESIKENIREEFRKEIESLKEKNKSLARESIIEKYISMLNIDKDNKAFFKKFMDYVFEKECENIESGIENNIENNIENGMEKKVYKDMPSDADNYISDDMSSNIIDEDFDEDVYEEVARVAIKNLLSLFENVKKTLYEKNNAKNKLQNNSNESEDNLLTVFDLVKINSIGLDSKDQRVREKYLSLYVKNNI